MKRCLGILLAVCVLFCSITVRTGHAEGVEVSAQACVLIEAATGRVLYAHNAYEKRPMASTTKIMTTLLCLESGDLDTEFTVDSEAIHVEGSSMGLTEGDIVTKRALCHGMLLPSGNDAANAAAVAVAGSIPAFVEMMNARAAEIGMTRTCFATPSGLDGEGHGASAYDMALLTRIALQNAEFREICAKPSAVVTFGHPPYERTLYNTNKLLTMCEGVLGVKTGFTDEAGRCLVSACERNGITLICVTLHAPDDWNDHMRLYDYGFSVTDVVELEKPGDLRQKVAGSETETVRLEVRDTVTIGSPDGDAEGVSYHVKMSPFAYAPVETGDEMGTLEYYYEGRRIAAVPLYAAEAAAMQEEKQPSPNPFVRFAEWLKGLWKKK